MKSLAINFQKVGINFPKTIVKLIMKIFKMFGNIVTNISKRTINKILYGKFKLIYEVKYHAYGKLHKKYVACNSVDEAIGVTARISSKVTNWDTYKFIDANEVIISIKDAIRKIRKNMIQ